MKQLKIIVFIIVICSIISYSIARQGSNQVDTKNNNKNKAIYKKKLTTTTNNNRNTKKNENNFLKNNNTKLLPLNNGNFLKKKKKFLKNNNTKLLPLKNGNFLKRDKLNKCNPKSNELYNIINPFSNTNSNQTKNKIYEINYKNGLYITNMSSLKQNYNNNKKNNNNNKNKNNYSIKKNHKNTGNAKSKRYFKTNNNYDNTSDFLNSEDFGINPDNLSIVKNGSIFSIDSKDIDYLNEFLKSPKQK